MNPNFNRAILAERMQTLQAEADAMTVPGGRAASARRGPRPERADGTWVALSAA